MSDHTLPQHAGETCLRATHRQAPALPGGIKVATQWWTTQRATLWWPGGRGFSAQIPPPHQPSPALRLPFDRLRTRLRGPARLLRLPLKGGVMRGVEQEKGHKQKSSFLCPHAHRPCTDCTRSTGAGIFHRAKFKILKTSPPASRTVPDARRSSGKPLPSLQTARSASPDLPRSPASPGATRKPPA